MDYHHLTCAYRDAAFSILRTLQWCHEWFGVVSSDNIVFSTVLHCTLSVTGWLEHCEDANMCSESVLRRILKSSGQEIKTTNSGGWTQLVDFKEWLLQKSADLLQKLCLILLHSHYFLCLCRLHLHVQYSAISSQGTHPLPCCLHTVYAIYTAYIH